MSARQLKEASAEDQSSDDDSDEAGPKASARDRSSKNRDGNGTNRRDSSAPSQRALVAAPTDVICGRGIHIANHRGNLDLHLMVNNYRDAYLASRRPEKTKIIKHVLKEMKSTGARFIRKVTDGSSADTWEEVDYATAYKKVSHALRLRTVNESNGKSISAADAVHPQVDPYGEPDQIIPRRAVLPVGQHDPLSSQLHSSIGIASHPLSSQLHAPSAIPSHPSSGHLHAPSGIASRPSSGHLHPPTSGIPSHPLSGQLPPIPNGGASHTAGVPPPQLGGDPSLHQIYRQVYWNTLYALQQQSEQPPEKPPPPNR
ncbi:unnamed protein product [Cylindrotheca closterium]|uniref:DUF6824 domain-containing protein n=1 Tax=Cylindrotheca closterium TaxID=2856 RepID=A0AAD2FTR5_9STRA|nr:unnamed protein product [Cylindrotheca closterium]